MNDWQRLYKLTEGVAAPALLTMARLRAAQALGKVEAHQVAIALAAGATGVQELLESIAAGDLVEGKTTTRGEFVDFGGTIQLV